MTKPDKILAHELLDREVLNLKAGEVAGSVVDFGINRDGKVQLIGILPVSWYAGGRGIAPSAIMFLTNDRLCIQSGDALQDFAPDGDALISTNSGGQIYGKTVLLGDGEQLGELVDFRFSLEDGKISDLLVLDAEDKRVRIPISGISTIGKDYIIIEKERPEGEAATAGESAAEPAAAVAGEGDESPFSEAAAAAPAPAAAKRKPAAKRPTAPAPTPTPKRSRGTRAGKAAAEPAAEPEVIAEAAPPPAPSANGIPAELEAAPPPLTTEVIAPSIELQPEPEAAPGYGPGSGGSQTEAFAGTGAAVAAAADETSLFTSGGQQISKFDQKKLDFLRGKRVPRDLKDADGAVLVAKDDTLDQAALMRIVEAGMLGEVFIEMTLRK